jgi:hypothetical protein
MSQQLSLVEVVPGLFQIGPSSSSAQATWVYYLLQADVSPPIVPTSLVELWNSTDTAIIGTYLFIDEAIDPASAGQFVIVARRYFGGPQPIIGTGAGSQLVAWLKSTPSSRAAFPYQCIYIQLAVFLMQGGVLYKSSQNSPIKFEWQQFGLEPSASFGLQFVNSNVLFGFSGECLQIWSVITDQSIQVSYLGQPQSNNFLIAPYPFDNPLSPGDPSSVSWYIEVPLGGVAAGAMSFGAGFSPGDLYATFGCGFQFSYGLNNSIYYPIFPPAQPGPGEYLGLLVRLHPLFPTNLDCSRLALDLSGTGPGSTFSQNSLALRSNFFSTPSGLPITLRPCALPGNDSPNLLGSPEEYSPPGWGFSMRPLSGGSSNGDWQYYLAPTGHFEIAASGSPSSTTGSVDMMGGLFAEEYVRASIGDWVEFVPNLAAYAPGFDGGSGSSLNGSPNEQASLTDTYTTSWMKYPSGPAQPGRAYFSQVSSSVYYGAAEQQRFPMPVSSLYSHLEPEENQIMFPIVGYGGVYASWNNQTSPNQNIPALVITAFESQVLTATRHANIPANSYGPMFLPPRASTEIIKAARHRFVFSQAPAIATTYTPQGILVRLNQAGSPPTLPNTWNALLLAVSPDVASPSIGSSLTISAPAGSDIIDPVLSNVLMKNQLFLVVSDPKHLNMLQNELSVGGFNFQLDVGPTGTLLIFKFNTSASLAQLAETPNAWADTTNFVDDVSQAQEAILNAIAVAKSHADSAGNPFGYFNQIAQDPAWTGILALNCAINGNGMPLDFQMLLGGIKGQLRAHHFGIQMNKVQSDSADGGLSQSSVFGVIYYRNPTEFSSPPPNPVDLDYEVETLTVVYTNSVITQFAVQVGLTINRLFGRATHLVSPPSSPPPLNTLVISGQYQKQGAIGTVSFTTSVPFDFEFPTKNDETRVIREVRIMQASLIPVSSTVDSPGTLVQASFNMSGEVYFQQNPFPNSDGLDLFSYGTSGESGAGIAFSGLTAGISFVLDAEGEMEKTLKTVTANLSGITFSPAAQSIRSNSLMGALPLQFSRFVYNPTGITQALTGTSPVHVLQLEGGSTNGSPAIAAQSPYGTTKPQFALEYDLPLGSLGSLSDGVAIMAKLLVAWGPSQVVPDNDGAAILVQLPSLSAGLFGFTLQGILKTTFGDANLLKVDLDSGVSVYAILFNNIMLSVFGYTFPPGYVTDFTLFAGTEDSGAPRNTSNIGWFLATYKTS